MPLRDDDRLRNQRHVFYKDDIERINQILLEFLKLSEAKCAVLIDKDGHQVTRVGNVGSYDMDTISALGAGSFAATKEMARLLGEEEFSVLFHQGKRDNIQLSIVGERALMAVIFDEQTTIGMVRLYASDSSARLTKVFQDIARRRAENPDEAPEGPGFEGDFDQSAKESLDNLFGEG